MPKCGLNMNPNSAYQVGEEGVMGGKYQYCSGMLAFNYIRFDLWA
jgi:hypothetical protein